MRRTRRGRLGTSLAETLLFMGLACVVGIAAMGVYQRGQIVTDETQKAILIQQDVRAIVEMLSRDMNAAWMVWDVGADRAKKIRLVKYADENTEKRIQFNVVAQSRKDYPFSRSDEYVSNRTYSYLVTYTYDPNAETLTRREETGAFTQKTGSADRNRAVEFSWARETTIMDDRVLGTNVKEFALSYFGYEGKPGPASGMGLLKKVADLTHLSMYGDEVKYSHTACLLLRIRSRFDEGVYAEGQGHKAPEAEMVTKIWSLPKLRDEMYREYFSSMDWDFRY